jgi:hypothetical protein
MARKGEKKTPKTVSKNTCYHQKNGWHYLFPRAYRPYFEVKKCHKWGVLSETQQGKKERKSLALEEFPVCWGWANTSCYCSVFSGDQDTLKKARN